MSQQALICFEVGKECDAGTFAIGRTGEDKFSTAGIADNVAATVRGQNILTGTKVQLGSKPILTFNRFGSPQHAQKYLLLGCCIGLEQRGQNGQVLAIAYDFGYVGSETLRSNCKSPDP